MPEAPAIPASIPGDIWVLGRHRLARGDCTDANTVAAVLDGVVPHDPPYGVDYDPAWRGPNGIDSLGSGKMPRAYSADMRTHDGAQRTLVANISVFEWAEVKRRQRALDA